MSTRRERDAARNERRATRAIKQQTEVIKSMAGSSSDPPNLRRLEQMLQSISEQMVAFGAMLTDVSTKVQAGERAINGMLRANVCPECSAPFVREEVTQTADPAPHGGDRLLLYYNGHAWRVEVSQATEGAGK